MWRTFSESNSGSYAGRIAPPGIPNTTSAPTRSSDLTRDCAPVSSSALSLSDIFGSPRPEDPARLFPFFGGIPLWMLRLRAQVLVPTKNPRCQLAGEGARRDELMLTRHADVRGETFLQFARRHNSRLES